MELGVFIFILASTCQLTRLVDRLGLDLAITKSQFSPHSEKCQKFLFYGQQSSSKDCALLDLTCQITIHFWFHANDLAAKNMTEKASCN
ncbi:hypothetical protein BKA67DRAFT_73788 [Truncatella angustata]|uniref:Uncharacterized protein n=1 Tax=Truncatella angustata TaxID=152316 RepID=A0A9P8UZ62_9PEZI|nr:uncharacterized protein BKA67DRAFT_73788 [Truncatella angustata]KAH6661063.1 hypothetical protein BKA67DRAFT_73788 [Truncatella angustata]